MTNCLGLKDRLWPRKVGTSLEMENMTPFPPNSYNFEIKGLSGKDVGKGITVLVCRCIPRQRDKQHQQPQTEPQNTPGTHLELFLSLPAQTHSLTLTRAYIEFAVAELFLVNSLFIPVWHKNWGGISLVPASSKYC